MRVAIVGAGLYGATIAHLLKGKAEVVVFESSAHTGGNVRTEYDASIRCHVPVHGAHIFHTNSDKIWNFITKFSAFNGYRHYVKGRTDDGAIVDLPFGMSLFSQLLQLTKPTEAKAVFEAMRGPDPEPDNESVEDWCLRNIGSTLYTKVVKGYTEKQWGKPCSELDSAIIRRLPIRFDYDNTYFHNAKHQGMPNSGYTRIIDRMLTGAFIHRGVQVGERELISLHRQFDHVVYSGMLDALLDYELGELPYRGLRFYNDTVFPTQGAPVINELSASVPYTRTIEHHLFYPEVDHGGGNLLTREYPSAWVRGDHPYYPVRDAKSEALYNAYLDLAQSKFPKLVVGGRLGAFRYYDMDQVVGMAMSDAKKVFGIQT
jgi:UDP-galactopyranose mutase